MNISDALSLASIVFAENEISNAHRESASLLCFILNTDRTFLIAHSEYELSVEEQSRYIAVVHRRAKREPFQYIVGTQEFFGLNFKVSNDVLIPRPETEVLVTKVIDRFQHCETLEFLEIGVGSGCITISVLKNISTASAVATDISGAAIAIAKQNAVKHAVENRVKFLAGDLFSPIKAVRFDAILSNPPYVPARDIPRLQPEVRDHEPYSALTDGSSGIELIEQIVLTSPKYLRRRGFIAIEIGFNQADAVKCMFDPSIWENVKVIPDLRGIDRVFIANLG
ncbi:MAG: peptide chain release factor N(5)-glutamine methyltransferase [Acidobacteriota bacterium]